MERCDPLWKMFEAYLAAGLPVHNLCDVSEYSVCHDGRCSLPFDPYEIAENLRRERYVQTQQPWSRFTIDLLRKAYYSVRPYLNVRCRRPLQRWYLKRWRDLAFPRWPVDTSAETMRNAHEPNL